ncbi:MAG TPA: bifunctional lysylphosphatidylglycerol flippase/synthetase MprF [Vicinamibacterales bacterium]|jgi:phosphatidylglycerol lysyltransferase|nr:bifunctional lysylphosphatidylglycerol flippase/synthetase MprF [Vicinamibacterales bacterium]
MSGTPHFRQRVGATSAWIVAHAGRIWAFAVVAIILALSWNTLRGIHMRDLRQVLHTLDGRWLLIAALATIVNVVVMGLYDVFAFGHTRTRPWQRWRFGAVAFCWSNFLTLGPLAGPAIRLWLYRATVDDPADLHAGIVSIAIAFMSGLAGWAAAAALVPRIGGGFASLAAAALVLVIAFAWIARAIARRIERFAGPSAGPRRTLELAVIGWIDWLLGGLAFLACLYSTGQTAPPLDLGSSFFIGQVVGLASLVPGGFGSADATWMEILPFNQNVTAAALTAYRFIYYIGPWCIASLVLLSWATTRSTRRTDIARRIIGSLVGAGGVVMIVSSASPALHVRLTLLQRLVPLPLVEVGHMTAAIAGLLLLAIARGLVRGYRAAFNMSMAVLLIAAFASMLKGLDWEESAALTAIGVVAGSQAALFTRESRGDWLEWTDLGIAFAAVVLFVAFGTLTHHLGAAALGRWSAIGYQHQAPRFVRAAASMLLALATASLYVLFRAPAAFERPLESDVARALALNTLFGTGTTPMMVAVGDKSVFFDDDRGFALYRTIGPYLTVFSDPVVRSAQERPLFLDRVFALARDLDRRVIFYQVSVEWIPILHDRGYHFFKLGEEAHVPLERVTLQGHAGKMHRQILRRAERDGLSFRIMPAGEVSERIGELAEISEGWLRAKEVVERQFSIGYFDPDYMRRFPCAIVEEAGGARRILAFANILQGPRALELSVDLMRYRTDGPGVMDHLILSLLLHAKEAGYRTFNLGMAPLASVGEHRGAHMRERLAGLAFRRGEQWYNFQGVRFYKQKFDPDWVPRYMAYEAAWEWPVALANVSALIAGSWGSALMPGRDSSSTATKGNIPAVRHA